LTDSVLTITELANGSSLATSGGQREAALVAGNQSGGRGTEGKAQFVENRFRRGKADYLYSELRMLLGKGSNLCTSLVFLHLRLTLTKCKDPGKPSFREREGPGQLEQLRNTE
ncbi:hypothetical protein KCU83_g655, partial [Aureobasidium melanogenum]